MDHTHECRDCGATIPAGTACYQGAEDCEWEGGNSGCHCEEAS